MQKEQRGSPFYLPGGLSLFTILSYPIHSWIHVCICCLKYQNIIKPHKLNSLNNTYFVKSISSHSSQILHASNRDTQLHWFSRSTPFPYSLYSTSLICRNLHYYTSIFQCKTLVLFTNFPKSIIKDAFGYAWGPSRLQSLKLQPTYFPLFQSVKLKENTLIFPRGWEIQQAFLWTTLKFLLGFTGGTWKQEWDRHNLRSVLFEAFLKNSFRLVPGNLWYTHIHSEICCVCRTNAVRNRVQVCWAIAQLLLYLSKTGQGKNHPKLTASYKKLMVALWRENICLFIKCSLWFPVTGNFIRILTAQSAVLDCRTQEPSSSPLQ